MKIIVTVDTEGDNLWDWKLDKTIETKNADYLAPFQDLCEKYKFYPVYLTDYEMAMSEQFVEFAKEKLERNYCEIGMHLHAWYSPPEYKLDNAKYNGNPYIVEYPQAEIYAKHLFLKNLLIEKFRVVPVSYRSGRWATNNCLFDVLEELGFLVDCSVTPGVYHKACGATIAHANNYEKKDNKTFRIRKNLIEVPMTTICVRTIQGDNIIKKFANCIRGERLWLRPALQDASKMIRLVDLLVKRKSPYLMFMVHSSELMPGGSPYCKNVEEVNTLLNNLEKVFKYISGFGEGILLHEYYELIKNEV